MTAVGVPPGLVAGNADDEPACELIITASLDAADDAVGVVASIRLSERRERGVANEPVFACPYAADMAADVTAGPTEVDRRRRRRRCSVHRPGP
jgi:hypothetical protein